MCFQVRHANLRCPTVLSRCLDMADSFKVEDKAAFLAFCNQHAEPSTRRRLILFQLIKFFVPDKWNQSKSNPCHISECSLLLQSVYTSTKIPSQAVSPFWPESDSTRPAPLFTLAKQKSIQRLGSSRQHARFQNQIQGEVEQRNWKSRTTWVWRVSGRIERTLEFCQVFNKFLPKNHARKLWNLGPRKFGEKPAEATGVGQLKRDLGSSEHCSQLLHLLWTS